MERDVEINPLIQNLEWNSRSGTRTLVAAVTTSPDGSLIQHFSNDGVETGREVSNSTYRVQSYDQSGNQFRKLRFVRSKLGFEDFVDLTWNSKHSRYEIDRLARASVPKVFFEETASEVASRKCSDVNPDEVQKALSSGAELSRKLFEQAVVPKAIDSSCQDVKPIVLQALAMIRGPYPAGAEKYNVCLRNISDSVSKKITASLSGLLMATDGQVHVRCSSDVSESRRGMYDTLKKQISLNESWANSKPSVNEVSKVLFHEFVHSAQVENEELVSAMVTCCSKPFDPADHDCQKAGNSFNTSANKSSGQNSPLDASGLNARMGKQLTETETTTKTVEGREAKIPNERLSADRPAGAPSPSAMPGSRPKDAANKRASYEIVEKAPSAKEMEQPKKAEEVAQRSHAVLKAGISAAEDAFKKIDFDKIAASTVGVPQAQAKEPSSSTPAHTKPAAFRNVEPGTFETKIVGQNPNGSPKIQLPDGSLLPSFQAFGDVAKPPTVAKAATTEPAKAGPAAAPVSNTPSRLTSGSSVSRSASTRASAMDPLMPGPSGSSAGGDAVASRSTVVADRHAGPSRQPSAAAGGGGSGGGGDSGGFSGRSSGGGSRTGATTRSSAGPSNQKHLVLSQLQPRSQATSDLANVSVNSWSDVKQLMRAAKDPKQLLKQQWFIDHLQRQDIRAQIIDHGVGYGSDDPIVRFDIKFLAQ